MKKKTIKIELSLNGKKAHVGHQFLEDISRHICDDKENSETFELLATSNNPEIREDISRNSNLTKKAVKILINDSNSNVVDNILSNSDAAKFISQKKLMKILQEDNIKHVCSIASNIEDFAKCDLYKIIKILANHENPLVRYNLVNFHVSEAVTTKILKQLSNDKDIDVASNAKDEYLNRIK